jgi:hypothetical protein
METRSLQKLNEFNDLLATIEQCSTRILIRSLDVGGHERGAQILSNAY